MEKYKLPKDIKIIKKGSKILFFNPQVPSWLVTNKNGELVLALCNGKRTIKEVVEKFGTKYGNENKEIANAFLIEAIKTNIFFNEVIPNNFQKSKYPLRILQLSLTSNCNLNCTYCYATDREEQGQQFLTFEDYQRIINDACKLSSGLEIVLTGGEPILKKDCFSIAEYAQFKGCTVHLLSNGTLIGENNINLIKKYIDLVIISVDGSSKELHEKHRGANSYAPIVKAIDLLDKYDINYQLSMTVNRMNIGDVGCMAKKYGSKLRFAPLFVAGNAKKNKQSISGIEYYKALSEAAGVNPLSYCESTLENAKHCKNHKCAIGDAEISISETGDIYPCQLLHNKDFYSGNVKDQSIIDIYNNSHILEECRDLKVDNIKGCSTCFLRYVCGGACRARAYHECGKANVSGKFCEYEKEAFVNGIFEIYSENSLISI
ncbi:MAG TPA: radical SAM protein [Paludibacter sp.]